MVIDVFSKYGWIAPLKNKQGETVRDAIQSIFKNGRKPEYLWTDKGSEFCNKHVKDLLAKNEITLYSTENEEKSSVVERWNRMIKNKVWKQFTVQGNTKFRHAKIKITVNRRFDVSNIILKIEVVYANVKVVKRELKILNTVSNMRIPQCLMLCKYFS